ncbi:MAG: PHP domain-containing protein [Oscillospiraceae bacterium]|nr:PHP domain-containing protein [Oscillospiraceae bacterium]
MTDSVDLHIHSNASDGSCTPSEIAEEARRAGLSAAALTDHDPVAGVEEFSKKCLEIGVEPIAGVEISAKYKCEMHILGLFVDVKNSEFLDKLSKLEHARYDRNKAMLEKFAELGMDITEADIISQKSGGTLENTGRSHMAAALVSKGYTRDNQEAFDKYLIKGKPAYVPRITYSPKESIEIIKAAGGIAVLAHPVYITEDEDELRALLTELKSYGLDGVESIYSDYTEEFSRLCLRLCDELKLLPSGGSDFHGANRPSVELGGVKVPYEFLQRMKDLRKV